MKKQGIQGEQRLPSLRYLQKKKICMQFTLKELFSLKFLLLHRKKIDFENF